MLESLTSYELWVRDEDWQVNYFQRSLVHSGEIARAHGRNKYPPVANKSQNDGLLMPLTPDRMPLAADREDGYRVIPTVRESALQSIPKLGVNRASGAVLEYGLGSSIPSHKAVH